MQMLLQGMHAKISLLGLQVANPIFTAEVSLSYLKDKCIPLDCNPHLSLR